jgi:hypothetical protein
MDLANRTGVIESQHSGWASAEFGGADLGDQRLRTRLIKIADRLSDAPESPINKACDGWSETKAAYRFFQNESVYASEILASHVCQVGQRMKKYKTILAIQDTSYFSYTSHKMTTGMGLISKVHRTNATVLTFGVIMHTAFAVTTDGLPLGILDQKISARKPKTEEFQSRKKNGSGANIPTKDKESIRWLDALNKTHETAKNYEVQIVTVCDRESDFYDFLELAQTIGAPALVRAHNDRIINKSSCLAEEGHDRLWGYMQSLPIQGSIKVEIPARSQNPARTATLEIRLGSFKINSPRHSVRYKTEILPVLNLHAVYVVEKNPPQDEDPLEWMLLSNLPVTNFAEAIEKVRWYCLRWRIEVFHKILKSGLKVEQCRLQTVDRLIRYLTVMSIIAWRIYWITLIARADPELSCTHLLAEEEWKVLYFKFRKTKIFPKKPPRIREAVRWIAMLGGFLGRKGDAEPGVITLWRGWKRLCDLLEGWSMASDLNTYG